MTTSENTSTIKSKIQVQIHLNFQKAIAAIAVIFFILILPIYLNESVGWANIYKRITQPPQTNPYSAEALAQREGTVQGISTSKAGEDSSISILENSNLNISKETMLILIVATLSVVVFFLMFFSLSYYEKKKAQQE